MTDRVGPEEVAGLLKTAVSALGGEHREGQEHMAVAVANAIAGSEHALIQAGTGTGKSLGYLVPAIAHAASTGERVVISTATLALQRQIFTKDLPLVLDALEGEIGSRPAVGLFKGRSNYLCLHKMAGGYPQDDDVLPLNLGPTSELGAQVARLHEWAKTTDTGDRDDLVPGVPGRAWAQVSVNGRECLESRCPMIQECFAQKARDESAVAQIVVTNHAILGVQATSHDMIGEHQVLIVDEAHELVQRITASATHELTPLAVDRAARNARRVGVTTDELDKAARALDSALGEARVGRVRRELPDALADAIELVRSSARQVLTAVGGPDVDKDLQGPVKIATASLTEIVDVCAELNGTSGSYVIWLAPRDGDYGSDLAERIVAAPLNVASTISDKLLAERASVMTSATLALGGNFDAIAKHLGVEDPVTLDAGSPFDYERQGIFYVASHLPKPGPGGISDAAIDELAALVEAAGGRTLGLFSSHRAAVAAAEALRERLDFPVLYQLDDQLPTLVKEFTEDPRACLFGSTALWQGIDVPGSTCSLVVIDRIPFPRPDDPIAQARTELVADNGGNGFMAVSATHAALLMAQGSGRLIRSVTDRGVVAVLDSRMSTAGYGGFLARSMPPLWPTADRDVVLAALRRLDQEATARQ